LTVTASGITLRVALSDPAGKSLVRSGCFSSDPIHIYWIADLAGDHALEIGACEAGPTTGGYRINIDENRTAKSSDADQMTAWLMMIEAERLRDENSLASRNEALKKFENTLLLARSLDDRSIEPTILRKIGEIYQERGDRLVALKHYNRALTSARQYHAHHELINILNDICFLHAVAGNYKEAQTVCSDALAQSRSSHDLQNEAQALSNIGWVHYDLGQLRESLEYQKAALNLWLGMRNREGQAHALLRTGYVEALRGEPQAALAAYQRALSLFKSVNNYRGQALVLAALGHLYSMTGSKQEALDYYRQAMDLSHRMEDSELAAQLDSGLGYVYEELGELEKALGYRLQALALYHAMPDRWGEAALHLSIGKTYSSMGADRQAFSHFERGITMARALPNLSLVSSLLREIGAVYERIGRKERALSYYKRSWSLSRSGENPRGEAGALNRIGCVYADLGRHLEALSYFNRALQLTRRVEDRFAESNTLYHIARLWRRLGRLGEAQERIAESIRLVESIRTRVASQDLRTSYFATVRQYYDLQIDILMKLQARQPGGDFVRTAFEVSEKARARALLEIIKEARAGIRREGDPSTPTRERLLHLQLSAKVESRARLLARLHTDHEMAAIEREISELMNKYDSIDAEIRVASPRYASLTRPNPLGSRQIQQLLDDQTLLLEYALGDECSYLWAVTRGTVTGYDLPGRGEIENAARRLHDLLTARQPVQGETFSQFRHRSTEADAKYWREAVALSQTIIGPVAGVIEGKRLLIIADGALQYIPFAALTVPNSMKRGDNWRNQGRAVFQGDPPVPLMVRHEVINLPSASILPVLKHEGSDHQRPDRSVAVLADPVFEKADPRVSTAGNPAVEKPILQSAGPVQELTEQDGPRDGGGFARLLASRAEADAIMTIVPAGTGFKAVDFDASRSTAINPELGRYRVVHFATHGLINSEHPELSSIVLSTVDKSGRPQNGFLSLHDIYNLDLPVELVVLSACETGLGKDIKGEGLIGLTRGFMYAGASSVMTSLWKVDDWATAELMKHFYRGLLQDGLSSAAALRAAQLKLWREERWRSPYFWAGFIIQGKCQLPSDYRAGKTSTETTVIIASVMAMVLLLGWMICQGRLLAGSK
jgi:CHAT domain-containing protein/Tfp pilus assembly protein PilF